MSGIDLSNYKELYNTTAHEYLGAMKASLLLLQTNDKNMEAAETLHRSAHSLKSQSALMGYKNTASISEFIEHTLRTLIDSHAQFTSQISDDISKALQKLETMLDSIERLQKEPELDTALGDGQRP